MIKVWHKIGDIRGKEYNKGLFLYTEAIFKIAFWMGENNIFPEYEIIDGQTLIFSFENTEKAFHFMFKFGGEFCSK